ncbi:TPA: DUF354 domain-containing protein [archaeon]|nr:DUF354 domain-containing protein [Candidatus Naiadarchaeales archaeon SRR2090153.bin461]
MKKVWIDILRAKQVMMFGRLADEISGEHELLITTREYKETNELLKLKGIDAKVVGRHGGGSLEGKLDAGIARMNELNKLVQKERPDVLVSLSSPEAARVAFGLKIPHICVNDIPESEAVTKLTAPLSTLIVAPLLIPKSAWLKYGVPAEKVMQYNALDPVAWLKGFKPNEKVVSELKIKKGKPIITFRTEEVFAAYLSGKVNEKSSVVLPVINELMEKVDANFVVLPRYKEQEEIISKSLNGSAIVAHHAIDGPSLLSYSDIFIGSGGTMTLEAALLGTPTISCRPFSTMYEDYAIKEGLVIKAEKNAAAKAEEILNGDGKYKQELKKKADKLMKEMDDPNQIIKTAIKKFV